MAETNKGIYYPTFAEVGEETYDGPVKMKMMAESIDPLLLSDEDKTKLDNIEAGAEVNVIESVKVNGTALTITDKAVDVPVPTKTSDLTNDSGFGTYSKPNGGIPSTDLSSAVQTSLGKADTAVQDVSGKEDKSNKVTSISSSSTNTQYPGAKLLYDKLAEKQEQIDALVEENSTMKKQQLKGQASGSSIQLTDSAEDLPIENVKLKGATEQNNIAYVNVGQWEQGSIDSTTGQNKLDTTAVRTSDYIRVYPNVLYSITRSVYNSYMVFRFYNQNKEYLGYQSNQIVSTNVPENRMGNNVSSMEMTIINEDVSYMRLVDNSNDVNTVYTISTENTPSLNYPQEIHCVTGTNNVNVQRKNIFPFPFTDAATTHSGVTVTVDSKNQTMSASGTTTSANFTWYFFNGNLEIKETYQLSSNLTASLLKIGYIKKGETARTWTTLASTSIFNDGDVIKQIYIQPSSTGTTIDYKDIYVQLEKGSTATEHTLYEEQNTPISLGAIKLYDGDKITIAYVEQAGYKKVTGANVVKNMAKVVLNGTENWEVNSSSFWPFRYVSSNIKSFTNTTAQEPENIYCDNFKKTYWDNTSTNIDECFTIMRDMPTKICFRYTDMADLVAFKTWLSTHNTIVVYPLATPTTTPITDTTLLSQLETLINMKTYKQITNIEATGSDLAPVLEFQYSKDLQTVIDNMQAQILS